MNPTRLTKKLDGQWRLVLDPDNSGVQDKWFDGSASGDEYDVHVPSVWDLWVPDYDGAGWYFRSFELDESWLQRAAVLQFDAVDYYAEVWLNGTRLGDHEGGYTPFTLDATHSVREGENLLAVRVIDPHAPNGFGPFHPQEIPCAKENGYFSFAGIWGGVTLVGLPETHIRDVFVRPDLRRKAVAVDIDAPDNAEVDLDVEGTDYRVTGKPGTLRIEMPEFETWSPESPALYTLVCTLHQDGEVVDRTAVRFGMREFTIKDKRFCLNGRPLHVKAVLHQPDYARSLAAPESRELARRELEQAKEAGFNMVRLHIKPAPPVTLELADELGLLIYEEPAIGWIRKSTYMQERCEREVREMILRDRNHPSIVIWGILNETGNAGYVTDGGAQTLKNHLFNLARSLDPTRVVIDDSGGVNATREPARFMRPYKDAPTPYDDFHIYQAAPVSRATELYYTNNGDANRLCFLSEFGFGGCENVQTTFDQYGDAGHSLKDAKLLEGMLESIMTGFRERALDRVFGGFAEFVEAAQQLQCDAARSQVDAIRSNQKFSGYCYTQLCDAGHEWCAGVLDRWRHPKPVLEALKAAQQPVRPLIHIPRTNLVPRQEVPVTIILANETHLEGRAELSLQVVGPTNQVLWKKKRSVKIPKPGRELWSGRISASGSAGPHKFVVRLMQGMTVLAENSVDLYVFEPVQPCDVAVNVLDPAKQWREKCYALAKRGLIDAPIHVAPPLANIVRAYPGTELAQMLAQVKDGAVGIVFGPPDDWNDLADIVDPAIRATSRDAVGAFLGKYHYVKLHPVFDGLPARGFMRQPYRNVAPPATFVEDSDEDICGTFDATPAAAGNYMIDASEWWGSDILVRRYGAGRLVFTHLRVLENLGEDPVADRLWTNMLQHFSRRSVPSPEPQRVHTEAVEWLNRERTGNVRRWMVIGEFPNWAESGHDTEYPPEREIDFDATYPGWYRAITWRTWYSQAADGHTIDFQQAFSPIYEYYPRFDYGTAYAYAELIGDKRQTATIKAGFQDAVKIWLNGSLIFERHEHVPHDQFKNERLSAVIRRGRNTILVKVSKIPGPFGFSIDLEPADSEPPAIKWWK